jgi:F-type H+-transporting ATPase subunit epsilon
MPLTLEIVTPEARVYSQSVDSVVIPTVEGEVGILPGHIPLVTQVGAGELRATKGGATELLVVGGGFAQVSGEKVSILADSAIHEEKIDEHAVADAMQRAEDALKEKQTMEPSEVARLESLVRFASAQLIVKRRHRR